MGNSIELESLMRQLETMVKAFENGSITVMNNELGDIYEEMFRSIDDFLNSESGAYSEYDYDASDEDNFESDMDLSLETYTEYQENIRYYLNDARRNNWKFDDRTCCGLLVEMTNLFAWLQENYPSMEVDIEEMDICEQFDDFNNRMETAYSLRMNASKPRETERNNHSGVGFGMVCVAISTNPKSLKDLAAELLARLKTQNKHVR